MLVQPCYETELIQSVTDGEGREEENGDTLTLSEDIGRTQTAGFIGLQMASEGSSWVSTPSLHINGSCCSTNFCCDDFIKETSSVYLTRYISTCSKISPNMLAFEQSCTVHVAYHIIA